MIKTFSEKNTELLFQGKRHKLPSEIDARAIASLQQLNAAPSLDFMRVPPSNRLEKLTGDLAGQHSIRINQRWRLCFRWDAATADAYDVGIFDYH